MSPKLIVSDLDGTLLGSDHKLDPLTIEVLRTLSRQGHHVALASGRHYKAMKVFRDQLNFPAYLISTNGAYTHDTQDHLLNASYLPSVYAKSLIELPKPPHVRLNIYRDSGWQIDADAPEQLSLHAFTGFRYEVVPPESMEAEGIGKVLYLGDPESLAALEMLIRQRHADHLHITYSTENSLEIMAAGVNKGVALAALLAKLKLPSTDCLAFGDNLNDTEMLNLAGEAQVMANASPILMARVPGAEQIGHHDDVAVAQWLIKRFALAEHASR